MEIQKMQEQFSDRDVIKIGVLSDLHLAIHKRENIFFPHIKDTIEYFVSTCLENEIDLVIITGDIFDTKNIISTTGLIKSNDELTKIFESFPTILITGNHDFAYTEDTEINICNNYKNLNNVVVIDQYQKLELKNEVLHLLPWHKEIIEPIKNIPIAQGKQNILFSHFGVTGFKVHEYASTYANSLSGQIEVSYLQNFDSVFLGHYHGFQTDGRITYISAPLQSRHGDELMEHGFILVNTNEPTKFQFIQNIYTPQFKTFELTKENTKEMLSLTKHYLRIYIRKVINKELVFKLKQKLLKENYDVQINYDLPQDSKVSVINGWRDFILNDVDDLIIEYVDKIIESDNENMFSKQELLSVLDINLK